MATINFLKTEAGRQLDFDTRIDPQFQLPFVSNYTDAQEDHTAPWDSGTWIAGELSAKVNDAGTIQMTGSGWFQLMPMFFFAGYRFKPSSTVDVDGSNAFLYEDGVDLSGGVTADPTPYTFRSGAEGLPLAASGEDAIEMMRGICQTVTLSGGVGNPATQLQADWFVDGLNDNQRQGFPFLTNATPAPLTLMPALGNNFWTQDAPVDGSLFDDLSPTNCKIISWSLAINFGAQPQWGADGGRRGGLPVYCGIRFDNPYVEWRPIIRTDEDTYQRIRVKYDDRTYQTLRWRMDGLGIGSRDFFEITMTGRWNACPQPHGRNNNEVSMQPVFRTNRFPGQNTNPHLFNWRMQHGYFHQ